MNVFETVVKKTKLSKNTQLRLIPANNGTPLDVTVLGVMDNVITFKFHWVENVTGPYDIVTGVIDNDQLYCGHFNSNDAADIRYIIDADDYIIENVFKKEDKEEKESKELVYIRENKIEVIFINQSIHIDDSIGVIKLKIFDAISKEASMSELYLYCLKSEKLNPITLYQNLTQNDRQPLTKFRMNQLLLNLYDEDGKLIDFKLAEKKQYTFDDILKLDLTERTYLVGKPLGQKFVFSNEYPFIADPFLVKEYDTLLENSRRETSTLSSNLLLETGPIFRNTIYLC